MSIKETIFSEMEQIRSKPDANLPPLSSELPLLESGLDSLGIAVLVTRLEDRFGVDPFTASEMTSPPVTVGDFVRLYEHAAQSV